MTLAPHATRADPPCSVFVEVEDSGIVQILQFSGIDKDDFPRKSIRVRQVDVAVLDHGMVAGIVDGVEELVFDLMEFEVSHAEALLLNPIISVHQARQHRSIRSLDRQFLVGTPTG